ncbi:hypothetical protein TNCV_1716791 [Trichonephila clavipes]|nr:hypothetical protein TNCV_1716791 [Trichonephila clavipes]
MTTTSPDNKNIKENFFKKYENTEEDGDISDCGKKMTVTSKKSSLLEKRPEYRNRKYKVIFLRDSSPSHSAKPAHDTLEALSWNSTPGVGQLMALEPHLSWGTSHYSINLSIF